MEGGLMGVAGPVAVTVAGPVAATVALMDAAAAVEVAAVHVSPLLG